MKRFPRRIAALFLVSLTCSSVAEAYYHFIRFALVSGQRRALAEKFDLNALPNKTLSYFIADPGSVAFSPSDTPAGLVSQIRAAAQAWNNVETSDLRLAFGGFITPGTVQTAPTLEILFDEMPPGVIAMGGPTVRAEPNGTFIPILKSVVRLPQDSTRWRSYSEGYSGTLVHELGHALGLQHTLTSSVMSTSVTRATSRAKTLTADDVAGISLLYPGRTFLSSTGSITGRVVLQGGQGVNLASVVAISSAGAAISTLTNPDGTYRIDGLPPRSYFVYVHPLPPPIQSQPTFADIIYPVDSDGRELGPGVPFDTVFYNSTPAGTNDFSAASSLGISAGEAHENVNFSVRPRNQAGIHSIQTFAYPNGFGVQPAYLSASVAQPFIVARGEGLTSGTAAVPGLRVRVLSGPTLGIQPFATPQGTNLQLYFDPRTLAFSTDTPRHLVFSTNNDLYVLPSGFFHVGKQPPTIMSVLPVFDNGARLAVISGNNLSEESIVLFDGIPGKVRSVDSLGRLTVAPPPAPVGHRANVTVLNADGQSSLFVQTEPPVYTYAPDNASATGTPVFVATPAALPAGAEAMVQIDAVNTNFVDGMTAVGFGNSDVVVTRLWVISPTRLLANVKVSPSAQTGAAHITIASGLQTILQPFSFQVQPANPRGFWLSSAVRDFATEKPSITAGSVAVLTVQNSPLPLSPGATTVLLAEGSLPVLGVNGHEVRVQIPSGTEIGPLVVRVESNGERSLPIVIAVDPPPPKIVAATTSNELIDGSRPVKAGESINLLVTNLEAPNASLNPSRVTVNVGGVFVNIASVSETEGVHRLTLVLPSHAPVGEDVPMSIEIDERSSEPISVAITE